MKRLKKIKEAITIDRVVFVVVIIMLIVNTTKNNSVINGLEAESKLIEAERDSFLIVAASRDKRIEELERRDSLSVLKIIAKDRIIALRRRRKNEVKNNIISLPDSTLVTSSRADGFDIEIIR